MKNFVSIKAFTFCALVAASCWCCQSDSTSGKSVDEIQAEGKISSIIRSPITAEGPIDTVNVAKMVFDEMVHDFGEIPEGEFVRHAFKFTNTGKVPLVINNVHSTCGCTIPQWPKEAIAPGKGGVINVEFNSNSRQDFQEKPVVISANTYPSNTTVYLKGYVNPKREQR